MLLVGIHRHGYGAWVQIRDDPDLGLKEKFFLEEHRVDKKEERSKGDEKVAKAPGAVHLVRRADYLLSVLKAKYSDNQAAKRAVENHHRNNKKHDRTHRRSETRGSISASPAPQAKKHRPLDRERAASHTHSNQEIDAHRNRSLDSSSKPEMKRKHSGGDDEKHHHSKQRKSENGHAKQDHQDSYLRVIFKPVRDSLKRVREATSDRIKSRKERASVMKVELQKIGNHIVGLEQEEDKTLNRQFWYVLL
jgi:chromodomain-helicase-DNA-binding protein 1